MKQLFTFLLILTILVSCSPKEEPIPAPIADFIYTVSKGAVSFIDKSKNAESYSWDFGNNMKATTPNPTTTYSRNGTYQVSLIVKSKGGEDKKTATIRIDDIPLTFSDVVDSPKLVSVLPGTWGVYVKGEDMKFNNYSYTFSESSNKMIYKNFFNDYYTLLRPELKTTEYTFSIANNIITTETGSSKRKYARIEMISNEEMKMYMIAETSNSYSESLPYILFKTSNVERNAADVIKATKLPTLTGIWDQGAYSIYTDVFFDFSAGKNYYQYNQTFQGAKSIDKYEFRIDENNVLYYRSWNSDFDPSWKKYKMVLTGQDEIELRTINSSGVASTMATYKLRKRK